jgi:thymidylate kinase
VLVEFFGLPGSGKSTLSRLVADRLRTRGLCVEEVTYELGHQRRELARLFAKLSILSRFLAARPRHALTASVRVAGTRQETWSDLGKSLFNWLFIASLAAQKRSPVRITMLDQGIAQALWSVDFAARQQTGLNLLLVEVQRTALVPDLIIHVRTDLRVLGDRLAARTSRFSRLDALARDRPALRRAEARGDAILARLRADGARVIEVANEDREDLASSARLITDAIMTMLEGHEDSSRAQAASMTTDRRAAGAEELTESGGGALAVSFDGRNGWRNR